MKARAALRKVPLMMAAVMALALSTVSTAFAHVTVKPGEVTTATYQVFTVSVPNEKPISTVEVKLVIPEAIASVTPTKKSGWNITTETEGEGDSARVASVTWSGGEISDGLRDEFTFSAKTPDSATELQWKAYQTYADGTVVAWDQASSSDGHGHGGDSGPFSVTNVVAETNDASAATDAKASADRALYVGVAGILVGLAAIFLATRKK